MPHGKSIHHFWTDGKKDDAYIIPAKVPHQRRAKVNLTSGGSEFGLATHWCAFFEDLQEAEATTKNVKQFQT